MIIMARWVKLVVGTGFVLFLACKVVVSSNIEVTISPPVTPPTLKKSGEEILLSLCPPKSNNAPITAPQKKVLIVSTLDGQLTALDLTKDGEMMWSIPTYPGAMLSSTISDLELDERGSMVRLIPSLTGKLYKFNGKEVEPMPMDAGGLLSSSLKMNDNLVFTGGKEMRTLGLDIQTGELQYECSMDGDCKKYFEETEIDTVKDILVVQRNTQTVQAHTPRSGEMKWNFSVSLHHVTFVPGQDLCGGADAEHTALEDDVDVDYLKTIVPEGVICSVDQEDNDKIKWRRKFQSPIVDVWEINGGTMVQVDLFSKNNVPRRQSSLLDDDDDPDNDDAPSLYIGRHNNQLYIQESIRMAEQASQGIKDYEAGIEAIFPRVSWQPYLVSPSRTPYFDHGADIPSVPLLAFDRALEKADSKSTSLTIINNAEYPLDGGYFLYPDRISLENNSLYELQAEEVYEEDEMMTVQFIYMSLWHWWKEVIFISMVTAVMMNVLIYRPMVHEMRDNFQQRSRDLVNHFQNQQTASAEQFKENIVVVEVPVHFPATNSSNNTASTPLTPSTNSDPSIFSLTSQISLNQEFSSRYLSDFEPVQCLGRGGFGVVFESKNKYDDINYAVKRITLPSSEGRRRKVKREVRVLAKLEHRHIVRYFSTWEETPPLGWQENVDGWLVGSDVGSGPTHFTDATSTDQSHSVVNSFDISKRFEGFSNNTFSDYPPRKEDGSDECSIYFGDYQSENDNSDVHVRQGWGDNFDDSSGGVMFEDTANVEELTGKTEAVSLQIDSPSVSEGPVIQFQRSTDSKDDSLSCVEALEWECDQFKTEPKDSVEQKSKVSEKRPKAYLYIVMQLCLKDTLRDWLRQQVGDVRKRSEVLDIFRQICVGVEYVHGQGLVHRDLKPSNIYFSSDGVIKIGDFGLVTDTELPEVTGGNQLTPFKSDGGTKKDYQLTDQVGTQMYMSPEQLKQKPYGHKVDIFSLGLIFLELLVSFSTQMERLHVLSDAKKGIYPSHLSSGPERDLLNKMLNLEPEIRPEACEIRTLPWIQEIETDKRQRQDIITNQNILIEENLVNLDNFDIMDEEILDN